MCSFRLGFEGVRVEGGGVVKHVEFMEPVELAEHEARAETDGMPLTQIAVDAFRLATETFAGLVEMAVVGQVMHANLKSVLGEPFAQFQRGVVGSLWNKVE